MYQKSSDLRNHLIISIYIDFLRFYFPFFCIHWLMGYHYEVTDWAKRINKYNSSQFADISGTKEYLLEYDRNLKRWNCVRDLNW